MCVLSTGGTEPTFDGKTQVCSQKGRGMDNERKRRVMV